MPTRVIHFFRIFVLMMTTQTSLAETALPSFSGFGDSNFLEVDKAFNLSSLINAEKVILRWQIAPKYYLYRHRLLFTLKSGVHDTRTIVVSLPQGKDKHDEYFGDIEAYYGELEVNVPVNTDNFELSVQYQGCADAGLCYPPQKRIIAREI